MVDSLKAEYEGQIEFRIADLSSKEGEAFAQFHRVGSVTLMFFSKGKKITSLQGEQSADFLRKAFDRTFRLKKAAG
ncbi:MAG: hypothetical protein HQM13_10150 [SAR324 cluster bacterium]|nr:hypothetical protein [SAR324 cluster bacterium]